MIDPKALEAAFGRVLAEIAALPGDGDVIAIAGKALRGARNKGHPSNNADAQPHPEHHRACRPHIRDVHNDVIMDVPKPSQMPS